MMRTITETYQVQEVSDEEAEIQIKKCLMEIKKEGQKYVTFIDFYTRLHLPPEQINRVMEKLEKKGVVGKGE